VFEASWQLMQAGRTTGANDCCCGRGGGGRDGGGVGVGQPFQPKLHMTDADFRSITRNGQLCDKAGGIGASEFDLVMREQAGHQTLPPALTHTRATPLPQHSPSFVCPTLREQADPPPSPTPYPLPHSTPLSPLHPAISTLLEPIPPRPF
jgi:hypothetical protein